MKNTNLTKTLNASLTILATLLGQPSLIAAEKPPKFTYEDEQIYMRLVLRTPEQLTAFYQGRQFKQQAIDKILETCFVTPIIKNKYFEVLWLELDNWQFMDNKNQPIKRITRDYWDQQWQKIQLKQAHQSTFGWTLMPEVRDLRFDEGVGGSMVIPWQEEPFKVVANFHTKPDKKGPLKTVIFEGVTCRTDISSE